MSDNLGLIIRGDKVVVSSKDVAENYEKEHKHVLEAIRNLIDDVSEAQSNFRPCQYINENNRQMPMYEMDRQGFSMLVMGFTGKKAKEFTYKYTNAFEEMAKELDKPKQLSPIQQLQLQNQVLLDHDERLNDLENNMPLFNVECKELQAVVRSKATRVLGGYRSLAYKDNSIRGKVYSDIQNQLKREFDVQRYEAIKRSQLDIAKDIVKSYRVPYALGELIINTNNQIAIGMDEIATTSETKGEY